MEVKSLILAKLAIKIRLLSLKLTLKLKSILSKRSKVLIKLMLKLNLINKEAIVGGVNRQRLISMHFRGFG